MATNVLVVLAQLLWSMLQVVEVLCDVEVRRQAISSSATFLVVFFVTLGNLTAFISGDAFNRYVHKLHTRWLVIYAIEAYLAAAFVWHLASGMLLTYGDKKLQLGSKFSWQKARLALSGVLFSVFVVVHVMTFRFGKWYTTTLDGAQVRDLWKLQKEVFASKSVVAFYVCSVLVIASHLFWGWQKTVRKPQGLGALLPKESQPLAEAIGNALTIVLTIVYLSLPLYTHWLVHRVEA